ncbi:UNVERIFIED_CONTAM: hypothetical protein Sangu_3012800 [Sesamum angustifolium]|uniref:Uncharacterized protein n=1 Tax=Sesamum angustifolium TaxID=2727405 RepID=A0AAW2KMP1_9LAMI
MNLDQNGFELTRPSIHNNVVRNLPLPKCDLTSHGTLGLGKSCTIVVNKEITLDVSLSHESCGATVEVKGKVVTSIARTPVPLLPCRNLQRERQSRGSQRLKANNSACIVKKRGIGRGSAQLL